MFKKLLAGAAVSALLTHSLFAAPTGKDIPFAAEAREIYKTAVETHTAKGHGKVPDLANYLAGKFKAAGFPEEDIHVKPVGETAVLIVRYRGDGSSGKKPISISAHMDVVEALASDWVNDPFKLIEKDGFFFGRGTLDDKLGITAVTTAFLRMKTEGFVPSRDLIIAFSGDEETGMISTKALVHEFRDLTDSEFVLNADVGGGLLPEEGGPPASFGLQAAEKTYVTFEATVRNPGGHSSRPTGTNAIYDLATALKKLEAYNFTVNYNDLTLKYFSSTAKKTPGDLGKAMAKFATDPTDEWAIKTLRKDPSFVGTVGTTCVATMLQGGHAENALPQSATATINCRIFPGEGVAKTLATLKTVMANEEIEFVTLGDPTETDASPLRDDVLAALRKAVDTTYPGLEIVPSMSSGGTDGMHFRAAGIPSYGVHSVYIKSSDAFAHGLNERLPVKTFYDSLTHWYVLLTEISK
ncbi:M20/M25/M40 family metallo-hydrolase [Kordiimonas pumila]|uniref:M20/M25/M40 family metallo-hydrolase n=1 Tax=Kordiimonas pumila TaxID=2161677 RepID=A0ABV7D733_9PROT|nr:M20/M25/M40 family metallo-hydrolase [Kordiimonas pumila]